MSHNPNESYYAEQQMRLVFDEYPDHGGSEEQYHNSRTRPMPFLTWATSQEGLLAAGFHELDDDIDAVSSRGTWKRGPDEFGRVVYLSFEGKACFVKHVYVNHKLDNSCFTMDHNYAAALYMGRDNAFLFFNFGPEDK